MSTIPGATPTIGPSTVSPEQAIKLAESAGALRLPEVRAYITELHRLATALGYNFDVPMGQTLLETDHFRSTHWRDRLNPGGIGSTDGHDQMLSFADGNAAARAMLVHYMAYVAGHDNHLRDSISLDPRFVKVHEAGYAGICNDLGDFGKGVWASDPDYAVKVAKRIDSMLAIVAAPGPVNPTPGPGGIVFGRVPKPAWKDRQIPNANNTAWDNLGQRGVKGVVYHRQAGANWGTDGWFRTMWQPNGQPGGGQLGLTDFGIDHNTGELLQWNDYHGGGRAGISPNRSGWASGPWENPPGDGRAYQHKYGTSAINRDLVSLEIAGYDDSPIGEAGMRAIVALSAYLADEAKAPWDRYPHNPATGLTFTYWHNEFTSRKVCPGHVVMNATPQIIERTKSLLEQWQATP